MKKHILFCILLPLIALSQENTGIVRGIIRDANNRELLAGVVVFCGQQSTSSLVNGSYELTLPEGEQSVTFRLVGYEQLTQLLEVKKNKATEFNVRLSSSESELNTVVVSTSRFGRKIQKETVSMDVFKPRLLETNNITNALQLVNKVPGVTVLDGSISIRGGSGYAYGSGSRVLMVVDELPLITPDRGEIRWELVPMENASQVEITKGSSTVQYGASALNGVIHVRTDVPGDTPRTKIQVYHEVVGAPPVASYSWWKEKNLSYFRSPHSTGASFLHKRKLGAFDLVVSGNLHQQQSHIENEIDKRVRLTGKLKYTPKKNKRFSVWLNANYMLRESAFQFWGESYEKPYHKVDGVTINEYFQYAFIDPGFSYVDKTQTQHRVLFRWFTQRSMADKQGRPATDFFVADYQLRHDFGNIAKLFVGATNNFFEVKDNTLGIHRGNYGGAYIMTDITWKNLTVNLGTRLEYLQLNDKATLLLKEDVYPNGTRIRRPVMRIGMNYQIGKFNYLRASFGEAYRFPSIAERFVSYSLADINVIPNDTVRPEYGLTAEIGYKRSFKVSEWRGYVDAVVFYNEFRDMIEFQMDRIEVVFDPGTGTGEIKPYFQSKNITKARIFGWELSCVGEGKIGKYIDATLQAGWTYFYPMSVLDTGETRSARYLFEQTFTSFNRPDSSQQQNMLKYRNRHSFKADIDLLIWNRFRIGSSLIYYSYMDNVDGIFEYYLPGASTYRRVNYNRGDFIWDLRLGYDINRHISFNFIVKNVMNRDYQLRVSKSNQPRSFNLTANFSF